MHYIEIETCLQLMQLILRYTNQALHFSISICTTMCFVFFFFFQAEDGIRDLTVTGVQTCALPILPARTCTANLLNRPQFFQSCLLHSIHRLVIRSSLTSRSAKSVASNALI